LTARGIFEIDHKTASKIFTLKPGTCHLFLNKKNAFKVLYYDPGIEFTAKQLCTFHDRRPVAMLPSAAGWFD
jgi:hypothetical protein